MGWRDATFGAIVAIAFFEAGKHLFVWLTGLAGQERRIRPHRLRGCSDDVGLCWRTDIPLRRSPDESCGRASTDKVPGVSSITSHDPCQDDLSF